MLTPEQQKIVNLYLPLNNAFVGHEKGAPLQPARDYLEKLGVSNDSLDTTYAF